ncbi:MAG: nucleoside deaminase [Verrucomicrobia bacterium]|nr:nucleoside deaminase [Verrucomicrobiota bacterium]
MNDTDFMQEALVEARAVQARDEYPVGAVVVHDGKVVGRGRNATGAKLDPTAHAEVEAIRAACRTLGRTKLADCTLYTTLFPCPMCEMAIKNVRITRVVYGGSPYRWVREVKFGRASYETIGPVLESECRGLFTAKLRELGRQDILDYEAK